ncbi:cyclase family protein [Parvicella tangerina]|uniref:Kynurenine formamidase n=1 Tax=Parvicella tangerina TaxID=2829795 RepID=A0A916NFD3_9FLAO|nr:cyclase family protein [Parvicella tangerina]CAG5077482.1 Kynurenine formamidase [Parvicella tangerina]
MKAVIAHTTGNLEIDFSQPIDISIHTSNKDSDAKAWYVDPVSIEPVRSDAFLGSVKEGGAVNFRNITFNPHGNTTHTESVGHIAEEIIDIQKCLTHYFMKAQVITITPEDYIGEESEWVKKGDKIISSKAFEHRIAERIDAIIIRTLPNNTDKRKMQWSDTNWPYLLPEAAKYIASNNIHHLLIDLPSVDREHDGGRLLAHRAFWNYPENPRLGATITEMIYVPDDVKDGLYMLNLQPASFVNDASPCKPVIYKILNQ